jgi:hypothetical protein
MHDLLVSMPDGIKRAQVKTTPCFTKVGWIYLILSIVVAGRTAILLRTYKRYIVGSAAGLMGTERPHAA